MTASPSGATLTEESYARAALTYLVEPADHWLNGLIAAHGAARTLEAIRSGRLPDPSGDFPLPQFMRRTLRGSLERWRVRLDELPTPDEVIAFRRSGIRLSCPGDPEWPEQLADLGVEQPYALWLRGTADLRFNCLRSVAVVGSRAATAYGSYVAAELAASVAARGWAVVSGGAFGVDASAHRGALGAALDETGRRERGEAADRRGRGQARPLRDPRRRHPAAGRHRVEHLGRLQVHGVEVEGRPQPPSR